jgi:hypothetical protein
LVFFNKKLKYIHNLFPTYVSTMMLLFSFSLWVVLGGHHQALAIPCFHGIDNSKVGFNFNTFSPTSRR